MDPRILYVEHNPVFNGNNISLTIQQVIIVMLNTFYKRNITNLHIFFINCYSSVPFMRNSV